MPEPVYETRIMLSTFSMKLTNVISQLNQISEKLDRITDLLLLLPEQQAATYIIMKREAEDAARQGKKPTDIWEVTIPGRAMQEEGRR